jgi:hypothetical protein
MTPEYLWSWFPIGYTVTVLIEAPILFLGLSHDYPWKMRLFAGFWLTACTYPIVFLVMPLWLDADNNWGWYLLIAETFAPLAECFLFDLAIGEPRNRVRDWLTIIVANLASFLLGLWILAWIQQAWMG